MIICGAGPCGDDTIKPDTTATAPHHPSHQPTRRNRIHVKIDLYDAYIRVWIRPEDILCLTFVVTPCSVDHNTLIGFYLSPTMGYVDNASYF